MRKNDLNSKSFQMFTFWKKWRKQKKVAGERTRADDKLADERESADDKLADEMLYKKEWRTRTRKTEDKLGQLKIKVNGVSRRLGARLTKLNS